MQRIMMAAALAAATAGPAQAQIVLHELGTQCLSGIEAGCASLWLAVGENTMDLWVKNLTATPVTVPGGWGHYEGVDSVTTVLSRLDHITFDLPGITALSDLSVRSIRAETIGGGYDPTNYWYSFLVGERATVTVFNNENSYGIYGCTQFLPTQGYRTCGRNSWVVFRLAYEGKLTGPVGNVGIGHYTAASWYFEDDPSTHGRQGWVRCGSDEGEYPCMLGETFNIAPEPVSLILLGTGLAGVAAVRRRRDRRVD